MGEHWCAILQRIATFPLYTAWALYNMVQLSKVLKTTLKYNTLDLMFIQLLFTKCWLLIVIQIFLSVCPIDIFHLLEWVNWYIEMEMS